MIGVCINIRENTVKETLGLAVINIHFSDFDARLMQLTEIAAFQNCIKFIHFLD